MLKTSNCLPGDYGTVKSDQSHITKTDRHSQRSFSFMDLKREFVQSTYHKIHNFKLHNTVYSQSCTLPLIHSLLLISEHFSCPPKKPCTLIHNCEIQQGFLSSDDIKEIGSQQQYQSQKFAPNCRLVHEIIDSNDILLANVFIYQGFIEQLLFARLGVETITRKPQFLYCWALQSTERKRR